MVSTSRAMSVAARIGDFAVSDRLVAIGVIVQFQTMQLLVVDRHPVMAVDFLA